MIARSDARNKQYPT